MAHAESSRYCPYCESMRLARQEQVGALGCLLAMASIIFMLIIFPFLGFIALLIVPVVLVLAAASSANNPWRCSFCGTATVRRPPKPPPVPASSGHFTERSHPRGNDGRFVEAGHPPPLPTANHSEQPPPNVVNYRQLIPFLRVVAIIAISAAMVVFVRSFAWPALQSVWLYLVDLVS